MALNLRQRCQQCDGYFIAKYVARSFCSKSCATKSRYANGSLPAITEETRRKMSKSQKDYFSKHPNHFKGIKRPNISGSNHPNWGKKHPPELIEKMRLSRVGKTAGEKHPNWKGGISDHDKSLRVKFRRIVQKKIFVRDSYTCQICDQHGGYLQVDHIKSWADHPELRFEESNCRTLCMACHYYVTFKRKIPDGVIWGHNLSRRITS